MTSTRAPERYDLVVASSRLPVTAGDGEPRWVDRIADGPAALGPAIAARRGAWLGWTGRVDAPTGTFQLDGLWLHPVGMSQRDVDDHEQGYCAATLAPLYHGRVETPQFRDRWRQAYQKVNERFAAAAGALAAPGGVVWVHDYHLQAVPTLVRRQRPDLLIGVFLHAPFPPVELFVQLPARTQILSGLLGADLIGFAHPRAAASFLELAEHLLHLPVRDGAITVGRRRVHVGAYPMSIDAAAVQQRATDPDVNARAASIRARLNQPRTVLLAVNQMDPAEGIEQRLDAYASLLGTGRLDPTRTVLVEVAAPDGPDTARRERLRTRIERRVAQINGEHSRVGHPVIHYLRHSPPLPERVALYLAADVLLATPLSAGTCATAKEFVVSRTEDTARLVLSEFGAESLSGATRVNPHDPDAFADAIAGAATEAGGRSSDLRGTRERLLADDVHQWTGRFLQTLGERTAAAPDAATGRGPRYATVGAPP